ncbi:hypothetical protein TSAR_003907 [Trichomalopsis sarcophagae]|uniref:Uncharacterized protein n=1 Tax=Trichomalopsis sarcophagae TaxID=543379 RepID=A0A232EK25_9HYME|nr:hypothetical protein TSAR_003907 [Trichomalopsis sarcophagae]
MSASSSVNLIMSTLKRLILLAVLCLALTLTNGQLIKLARDTHYEASHKSDLFVDRKSFSLGENKGNLTFVTCPKGYHHHSLEKNCTIGLDTQPGRSCPVTLKTSKSLYFTEYLEVFPLAPAKAVIVWGEFNQTRPDGPNYQSAKILIRYTVVDVNTCKNRQLELQPSLNYTTYLSQVADAKYAVYDDSFEIIIENAEDPKYLNKYKIDGEGNIVLKSVPWIIKPASEVFLPVLVGSKLKGYLHNDNGPEGESRLYMLNADSGGSEKLLLKFRQDLIYYQDISTAHNTIGVARCGHLFNVETNSSNSRVDVVQFDQDGKLKLNTTFNTWIRVQYLELHNLPAGGFILVIGGCSKDEANCDRPEFGIQKFVPDGTVVGSSKFPGIDSCKGPLTLQVFESEPKKYCVAYLCSNAFKFDNLSIVQGKQFVDLLINCYTDDS